MIEILEEEVWSPMRYKQLNLPVVFEANEVKKNIF